MTFVYEDDTTFNMTVSNGPNADEIILENFSKHNVDLVEKVDGNYLIYNDELIGIISEGDCIKHISDSKYYNMPIDKENTVEKNMASNVETIDKNMNIFDAATKFISSKRRRFPIVENGKLIGQISQKDILKAAIKVKGNNWK